MPEPINREDSNPKRRTRSPMRKAARALEMAGGILLCALAAATPWLFGTTEEWSVRLMNVGSCAAGVLFLTAAVFHRIDGTKIVSEERRSGRILRYVFLGLNLAILAFCGIALWNARASFSVQDRSFNYHEEYNPRLPTTYDADLTRDTLWTFVACFVAFWSLRYWLLQGMRRHEDRVGFSVLQSRRFQAVVWVISLNGLAVAVQGILQRLSGSAKLLWFRDSWWGEPLACFGPFSYRGNAAEFLNLLWPVALGFWWVLSRERRQKMGSSRLLTDGPELLLIPATAVMISASIISLSRGGVVVAVGILLAIGLFFFFQKNISWASRVGVVAFVTVVAGAVWFLGWEALGTRFKTAGLSDLSGREEIYANAEQMARDYPYFGTGPGTFRSVYHLYRKEAGQPWHGFLHDDWLETRVTFGWVGLGLVIAHLVILAFWVNSAGRPPMLYVFHACAALGLVGALVHARFDFPFQTYSILFTFVVICAILSSASPARR